MTDYGFYASNKLSAPPRVITSLLDSDIKWSTTGEYREAAKNHCASTLALNFFVLDAFRNGKVLAKEERDYYFEKVHGRIGDGPVAFLASKVKGLFQEEKGKTPVTRTLYHFQDMKDEILQGNPVAFLLRVGLFNWHWVMATGIAEVQGHNGSEAYVQIVDNWNPDPRYYKMNEKSKLWSMTSYHFPRNKEYV